MFHFSDSLDKIFKDQLEQLVKQHDASYTLGKLSGEVRPWGGFVHLEIKSSEDRKILWVDPVTDRSHQTNFLSLQFHGINTIAGHEENWHALTPAALILGKNQLSKVDVRELDAHIKHEIENELELIYLPVGEEIFIPAGTMHALINPFVDERVMVKEHRLSLKENKIEHRSAEAREADIKRVIDLTRRDGAPSFEDLEYAWILDSIKQFRTQIIKSKHKRRKVKLKQV